MARVPRIPAELKDRPFSLAEARAAGLSWHSLQSKAWRRLGTALYCWSGLPEDPWQVLSVWQDLLPADAVFAGETAAWISGLDFSPTNPVEVVVPPHSGVRSRPGLRVRRCTILPCDSIAIRGLRTTTLNRALRDLSLRLPTVEVLVAIDMAMHRGLTPNCTGRKLRFLAALAAPAESPMETRLRWLLLQRGLPRPEVQTNLYDSMNRFVGRADLFYPAARVVLEYDGGNHRERLVEDDRRQNLLVNAGFRLLRFTATDIHNRPELVEAQVRSALSAPLRSPSRPGSSAPRPRSPGR
jgi:very-short-patch-repair endonuclease